MEGNNQGMKEPQIFQLQKFWALRQRWYGQVPGFEARCEVVRKVVEKAKTWKDRARPRQELMTWFIEQIKRAANLEEILASIPQDEPLLVDNQVATVAEFLKLFPPAMLPKAVEIPVTATVPVDIAISASEPTVVEEAAEPPKRRRRRAKSEDQSSS
jgi:hypothetical protein